MSVRATISGAVAIFTFVSVGAAAENYSYNRSENSFYIDVKLGRAFLDLPRSAIDQPLADAASRVVGASVEPSNLSRSSGGYGLGGGYAFTRYFAVEADYYRLGNFHGTVNGTYQLEPFVIQGTVNVSGPAIAVVGMIPLNARWSIDARVGDFYEKVAYSITGSVAGSSSTAKDTTPAHSNVLVGLGIDFALFDDTSFRLEGIHFNKVGDSPTTGQHSIDAVTLGIRWKF